MSAMPMLGRRPATPRRHPPSYSTISRSDRARSHRDLDEEEQAFQQRPSGRPERTYSVAPTSSRAMRSTTRMDADRGTATRTGTLTLPRQRQRRAGDPREQGVPTSSSAGLDRAAVRPSPAADRQARGSARPVASRAGMDVPGRAATPGQRRRALERAGEFDAVDEASTCSASGHAPSWSGRCPRLPAAISAEQTSNETPRTAPVPATLSSRTRRTVLRDVPRLVLFDRSTPTLNRLYERRPAIGRAGDFINPPFRSTLTRRPSSTASRHDEDTAVVRQERAPQRREQGLDLLRHEHGGRSARGRGPGSPGRAPSPSSPLAPANSRSSTRAPGSTLIPSECDEDRPPPAPASNWLVRRMRSPHRHLVGRARSAGLHHPDRRRTAYFVARPTRTKAVDGAPCRHGRAHTDAH